MHKRMRSLLKGLLACLFLFSSLSVSQAADEMAAATYRDPTTGMEFVFVKGGCFQMGDTFGDGRPCEKPVHEVCVDDFYMGKYMVTQEQWKAVMRNNPSSFKDCGNNCPVETVSWNDAQAFIQKVNKRGYGNKFRLPTEAEWEYAARSGGKQESYGGDNNPNTAAWFFGDTGISMHPVDARAPNELGLYNMSSNVWQWIQDRYGEDYYAKSPHNNPQGPSSGQDRVLRGGSWLYVDRNTHSATRFSSEPDARNYSFGFRLARSGSFEF